MYTFLRTDKRTLMLLDAHGAQLGSLVRTKWHGQNAEIIVPQGVFRVERKRGLTMDLVLFAEDVPLLLASYTWRGITITDTTGRQGAISVRRSSFLSPTYHVLIREQPVLKLRLRISWKYFELDPTVVEGTGDGLDPLTLLFAVYAIQVQQRRASMAAAS